MKSHEERVSKMRQQAGEVSKHHAADIYDRAEVAKEAEQFYECWEFIFTGLQRKLEELNVEQSKGPPEDFLIELHDLLVWLRASELSLQDESLAPKQQQEQLNVSSIKYIMPMNYLFITWKLILGDASWAQREESSF